MRAALGQQRKLPSPVLPHIQLVVPDSLSQVLKPMHMHLLRSNGCAAPCAKRLCVPAALAEERG